MAKLNLINSDYNHLQLLLNDSRTIDIKLWDQVDNFSGLKSIKKSECLFACKSGIYSLIDDDGHIAYIGKAKCLHDRLSSHSKALVGGDEFKAPAWHQFFKSFEGKTLIAKYVIIDGFSDAVNAELGRRAIECALQMIYKPYFDQIYHEKRGKIKDFERRLSIIKSVLNKELPRAGNYL